MYGAAAKQPEIRRGSYYQAASAHGNDAACGDADDYVTGVFVSNNVRKVKNGKEKRMKKLKTWKQLLKEEDGMGTVEIILIIVVLVGLVIIFKEQITAIVNSIFKKINTQTNKI